MTCISCNTIYNRNYCPNCGEKHGIKKINFSSLIEDAFSTVTNMDKGFLYNIKALFIQPKEIVTSYIKGKRKGILNPISYLIISITIYIIIITVFKKTSVSIENNNSDVQKLKIYKIATETGYFLREYIKYFWILSIIPLGLTSKIIFKKYNFFEHLAISSFVIGQATLIGVISYLIFKFPLIFDPIVYLSISWLLYKIFKDSSSKLESIVLSFLALFLFLIQLALIIIIISLSRL